MIPFLYCQLFPLASIWLLYIKSCHTRCNICLRFWATFIPIVVDTFGGLHPTSLEALSKLGRKVACQGGGKATAPAEAECPPYQRHCDNDGEQGPNNSPCWIRWKPWQWICVILHIMWPNLEHFILSHHLPFKYTPSSAEYTCLQFFDILVVIWCGKLLFPLGLIQMSNILCIWHLKNADSNLLL